MNSQSPVDSVAKPWVRYWPWLVLALVLSLVGYIRLRFLQMPLERDEGEFAYAGQLILQGIPPYELAYNMKLPGTYYAYAAGMAVFGQSIAGIHLTLLVVNSLTSIFTFLLGRKLFGVTAGLVACTTFALMSVSEAVLGLAAHATQFVVLPAVAGTWLLLGAVGNQRRLLLFSSGLLFGLAFLMKQPGICFGLFGLVMLLLRAVRERPFSTRVLALELSAFGGGLILPFILFCLSALVAGDFARFWFWTFRYAGLYAGEMSFGQGMQHLARYVLMQRPVYGGFALLAVAGLAMAGWRREFRKEFIFVAVFSVFSFLGTTPGWYFREHYFVLLLPAIAILAGMGVVCLQAAFPRPIRLLPPMAFAIVVGWSFYPQHVALFEAPASWVCEHFYPDNPFLESVQVGQYIHDHSQPNDRVAVIGSEPQIYFYANRHSATGYIYTYALMEPQPYAMKMQHEMMDEVGLAKPEYIVLVMYKNSWLMDKASDPTIFHWVRDYTHQFYERVELAGRGSDGGLFWQTNPPAIDPESGEYMVVYRRKIATD